MREILLQSKYDFYIFSARNRGILTYSSRQTADPSWQTTSLGIIFAHGQNADYYL